MSRAEEFVVPPDPRLRRQVREALTDFYFNAWSFLGANLILGFAGLAILYVSTIQPVVLLLLPVLILPAAGTMRMATRLVRDGHTDLGSFTECLRRPWAILVLGTAQLAITAILFIDLLVALSWGSWLGTVLLVAAGYGLAALWAWAAVAWPLLLDPLRDGEPVGRRLRLGGLMLLAHPVRMGAYALLVGGLLLISSVLIVPAATFAVAVLWLVAARYVLPLADRAEGRATRRVEEAAT